MTRRYESIRLLLITFLLIIAGPSSALDTYFSGFGTASLSCFTNDSADYVMNTQAEGPGRSQRCDAGLDSLLGVQLDTGLSDAVEFGLQVIVDRNVDLDYSPEVSVAQLRWHPTNSFLASL